MKHIEMNKVVDVYDGKHNPYSVRYKSLAKVLENDAQIIAEYPQGMKVSKERWLEKLGYKMVEPIWTPDPETDPIWSPIKSVWSK